MRTMAQFLVFGLRNPTRRLLCLKGHLATFFGMTKVLCTRFAGHDQKSPQYHHPQAPQVSEKVCVCVCVSEKEGVSVGLRGGGVGCGLLRGGHTPLLVHPSRGAEAVIIASPIGVNQTGSLFLQ